MKPLKGEIEVPGDKSISHRSLIFSAIANGESKITGLLEGEDVLKTAGALKQMGVEITKNNQEWIVNGVGVVGLSKSEEVLDMGNSGTAARLLAGLVTPYNFSSTFDGDESLRKRPMQRIFTPIQEFGASISARDEKYMPFTINGRNDLTPISYKMPMASAQVKSCILLAALGVRGTTEIFEPDKCRNHSEIMMKYLGLDIDVKTHENGNIISYQGFQEFGAKDFTIPGDISSAAFLIVAALIVKDSNILIKNVGINPLRDGIIISLKEMGANIEILNEREVGGEKVGDIKVEYSKLTGIEVPAARAASMIDEYPIFAIAAANASGITKMHGLEELKVKESNRLQMIADNLANCGATLKMGEDYLEVQGGIKQPKQKVKINTSLDHRIAMSFYVLGLVLENGIELDDTSMVKTSFPNFFEIFDRI